MIVRLKRCMQRILASVCVLALFCPVLNVCAEDVKDIESKSSALKSELDNINAELLDISDQIAENELKMETINGDIARTEAQLSIAKKDEERQFADMQLRIQYIYENDGESLLGMIFSADSLADFVNKVDFVSTLNLYDRGKLNEFKSLRETIESEEEHLKEQKASYVKLEEELNDKKAKLNAMAEETSADLEALSAKIQAIKEEEARKAEEAAKEAASAGGGTSSGSGGSSGGGNSSGGGYNYPSGPGQLNPFRGVVWYGGHRETYYSQRVLPGGGLNIPGRHVAGDGTIRDGSGYLCLAAYPGEYPKKSFVETSLGTGIVYDVCEVPNTIDIYTDW